MRGSIERVTAVVRGELPDRPPLYDLLRNDAVISYFAGDPLTLDNAAEAVYRAYEPAIDATRPLVRLPNAETTVRRADGRYERRFRWTTWIEPARYADAASYAAAKRAYLDRWDPAWTPDKQRRMEEYLSDIADQRRRLGEVFFFPGGPCLGLMGIIHEVGLEHFAYYHAEFPDVIDELLEVHALDAVTWIGHLPEGHGIVAVFAGDDIAFKGGPLLSPTWFEQHYFDRMARLLAAYHERGIRVLFHSDGNLNALLDGLVDAGIDGLNPIEVVAGMDVGEIHRKYPDLFMADGIDVSQLLPYGSPAEVKETVRRTIEAAEGRLLVGSSTELNNEVPLENYLALREAVLEYTY